jgi:GH15 family glucan-1,4-alpha-glucosidase
VEHRGKGAVLASLPPGEWTYAWIRDGAYAVAAMATLGMASEARDGLLYYLKADSGKFQGWDELKPYAMPPYQISLVRYHGFGIEETDFNDFGPNLEFDGFGLFLWALRNYEDLTGDQSLVNEQWGVVSTRVADVLVALIDPETGLVRRDSSIWETHWKGRERFWAYTSITAARGLCDAAALAARMGDSTRAEVYKTTGEKLREAIAQRLTDASGALASNVEELASGSGYYDAAVLDAIAMGLFDPKGPIAAATLKALDEHLLAPAGAGWSRNDDRNDHPGAMDLSPWGSEYDSAEWVVTNLRGAVAAFHMGDTARAEKLLAWVRDQSLKNYLAISETYDESTGKYKFNAPMAGFGAGVYALALATRAGMFGDPACGAYYQGSAGSGGAGGEGGGGAGGAGAGSGGSMVDPGAEGGCDCRLTSASAGERGSSTQLAGFGAWVAASLLALARRRRRPPALPAPVSPDPAPRG